MPDIKLTVFDLDGTLAGVGLPIEAETLSALTSLQKRGVRLALCSGKPAAHLTGLLRQAGLPDMILMGENGAVTQFGIALPPVRHYRLPCSPEALRHLSAIKALIEQRVRPVPWFQPNDVVLTPFFDHPEQHRALKDLLSEAVREDMGLLVFEHVDSFDICPAEINKGAALKRLIEELGIKKRQVAAIGDGANDVPLWREAGLSIQVGKAALAEVDVQADSIMDAIRLIG